MVTNVALGTPFQQFTFCVIHASVYMYLKNDKKKKIHGFAMGLLGVTLNRSEQKRHTRMERGAPGGLTVFVTAKENGVATACASCFG